MVFDVIIQPILLICAFVIWIKIIHGLNPFEAHFSLFKKQFDLGAYIPANHCEAE